MTDFQQLLRLLVDAHVEFIIIGGVAARAHGSTRSTTDVDVVYRRTPENIKRLVVALAAHSPYPRGAPPGLPFQWDERTIRNGLNFTLVTDAGELDLLGEVTGGGDYDDLLNHTLILRAFDQDLRFVDLPTLIRLKRAAGRPKDYESLALLEAVLEEQKKG